MDKTFGSMEIFLHFLRGQSGGQRVSSVTTGRPGLNRASTGENVKSLGGFFFHLPSKKMKVDPLCTIGE